MRILPLSMVLAACRREPTPAGWAPIDRLEFATEAGEVVLVLPMDRLHLGLVDPESPDEDLLSYNPSYTREVSTRWIAPQSARRQGDHVELVYPGGVGASLEITPVGAARWDLRWTADAANVGFFRVAVLGDAEEEFYGLGEYFDSPMHRGRVRAMHLEPSGETESGYNEAHVPIPLVVGTTGWALFVADDHPMIFEVATEAPDEVRATVGTGVDSAAGLRFHVYTAERPLDLTRAYYETTGFPALPAPWALGPLVWRDENTGQAQVEADLVAMRELDLAASAIWIDRPYATAVNSFDFDLARYPDPQAMIDLAHANGFRVGLWHTPYAEEAAAEIHAEAVEGGFFPPLEPEVVLALVNWGPLVDFTNPAASSWWTGHVREYTAMGIEGFKLDFAEDIIPSVFQGRLPWVFADGSDERTMHRHYQRLYHQAYRAALDGPDAGFLLCRAGAWGDQMVTSIVWPGDIDGNLALHGEDVGEFVAVGGLPAAVVAGISLGVSGYPFFGSDTGGYRHTPPDKETFTRWFQHTALSSVMQIGMSSSDVAWEFVRDWDEEMLGWYRDYTRLHLRLFPYLWTWAVRIADTGHPLVRPLGLAHPELGEHFPFEFMQFDYLLGADLLVAPVVRPGETSRRVVLPAGRWFDWFDGEVLEEGEHVVDAPLHKIPLFLREGGIVPLLRPTIDTLAPVRDPGAVDSFAADPGRLHARVFPGARSELVLYDGTVLGQERTGEGATLWYAAGDVFTAGVELEVVGLGRGPVTATLEADGEVRVP